MSRSERYIAPSEKELEQLRKSAEATQRFDRQREHLLCVALKKIKKADLVELTLRVAKDAKAAEWLIESEVNLDKPVELLVHDIERAIDIATQVDELRLNYNFDYDWRAYESVRRGLFQLIQNERVEEAKALALKLMRKGSHQMDCSDEGLMLEEIENCLQQVIVTAAKSPGGKQWALKMLQHDSSGCVCWKELRELAG